ncbi:hypothetical protein pdam_00007044 [Pocillopora damicornis]|uniref:Uncharacterized protein n=1 Tax=Pocillopora damicornis TaxID=46731 RepID=A0A3M6T913_POCDA|nr:hypothetical protein pdam_00007044 [Pocillopora damicornis]
MHCKNVLKVKAVCSGNACDWMIFRKCRNAVKSEIKQAKEKFFKDALHENEDLISSRKYLNNESDGPNISRAGKKLTLDPDFLLVISEDNHYHKRKVLAVVLHCVIHSDQPFKLLMASHM